MRAITQRYVRSAVNERRFLESTAPQVAEKLERILGQFETLGVAFGDKSISGLEPLVFDDWLEKFTKSWKPATFNNYVCIINPFLRWAYSRKILADDLSDILHTVPLPDPNELPPEQRPKEKYYNHEQVHYLLNEVSGRNVKRDRAIMAIALYGGLRVSEICALTITQVMDAPRGTITLRRKGGAWMDAEISEEVYPYLEAYLATREDTENRSAPLFITTHGNPCTRQQIYKAISGKQEGVGLATGLHALRHTAISEVNNRFGALAARDFANHKSMTVTNRYSHTTKEQRRSAADGLDWN